MTQYTYDGDDERTSETYGYGASQARTIQTGYDKDGYACYEEAVDAASRSSDDERKQDGDRQGTTLYIATNVRTDCPTATMVAVLTRKVQGQIGIFAAGLNSDLAT